MVVRRLFFVMILASFGFLADEFLIHWDVQYSSDTALVGLIARHILEFGEHPIFVWGVGYQGMLIEGYGTAMLFRLFGESPVVLCVLPIIIYGMALGVWSLIIARAFGKDVALLAAFLIIWSSSQLYTLVFRNIPNYPDALLIGVVIWLTYGAWFRAFRSSHGQKFMALTFALGILLGFGLYLFPISLYFAMAGACHFVCFLLRQKVERGEPIHFRALIFPYRDLPTSDVKKGLAGLTYLSLVVFVFGLVCLATGFDSLEWSGNLVKWDPIANLFYSALVLAVTIGFTHLRPYNFSAHFRTAFLFAAGFITGNAPSLYFKFVLAGHSINAWRYQETGRPFLSE